MKIENLTIGQVVYDARKQRLGNTTQKTIGVYPVTIHNVDVERKLVIASWNGNSPMLFREWAFKKWRARKPELIPCGWGYRLATREDKKPVKKFS